VEHHDLFDIQTLFEEMCKMLIDAGFDNITFRDLYIEKEIEIKINIPTNPSNNNQEPTLEYKYSNEERYVMKE
jgi:hypothetical protein